MPYWWNSSFPVVKMLSHSLFKLGQTGIYIFYKVQENKRWFMDARKLGSLICQSSLHSFSPFITILSMSSSQKSRSCLRTSSSIMMCSHSKWLIFSLSRPLLRRFYRFTPQKVDEKLTSPLSSIASSSTIVVKIHYYSLFFYLDLFCRGLVRRVAKQAVSFLSTFSRRSVLLQCFKLFTDRQIYLLVRFIYWYLQLV